MNVTEHIADVNEFLIIKYLRAILQEDRSHSLSQLVIKLYKCDDRIKDFIQNALQINVKKFLLKYPEFFSFDEESSTVTLTEELPIFSSEEISKHCTKDDAWIAVDGQVYDITEFVRTHWGWTSAGT